MLDIILLLLHSVGHQLLLGTLRADDVLPVRDETLAHHAALAGGADEAVIVPMATLERNETGSTNPCHLLVLYEHSIRKGKEQC